MKIKILNILLIFPYFHVFSYFYPNYNHNSYFHCKQYQSISNTISNKKIDKKYNTLNYMKSTFPSEKQKQSLVLLSSKQEKSEETILQIVNKKRESFLKLIRYKNILPTFLLSFSGGWLICPSWFLLWSNSHFLVISICTQLVLFSSMIINDLFDLDIDSFNMLKRPLVTGEVTKWEAILYICFLLIFTEVLCTLFLSPNLQDCIHFSIISLLLYTPIFKKITLIKNIFCAFFVAFVVFLGGNASSLSIITLHPNFNLFSIVLSLTFFGSLFNEIMLDIRDYDGDKFYNVKTIPVIIGKEFTWLLSGLILFYNIISNTFFLMYIKGVETGVFLPFVFVPVIKNFYDVKQKYFSKQSIIDVVNVYCGKTFLIILLFFYLQALEIK
jgi:4-hydroxybenzoate polyprenyltransferase